jgi:hypothetical protein
VSLVVLDTDVASTILRGRLHDRLQARLTLVDRLPLATFDGKDFADFGEYDGLRLFDVS